ncbi:type I methionyl aminopeptidase [Patescibacteria group bacterium]|nr:type I methionyl aminopeptidase [Patescibacteria group bacterium]MBU1705875.1 type I methionyl aminopeptidase [Patescibacteria group bacterium]
MALIKTPEEIIKLKAGGQLLSQALKAAVEAVRPGVKISKLNAIAEKVIIDGGGRPSFKGFKTSPEDTPFPSTVCISVNEEIVHGLGNRDRQLKAGDIVGLDVGCWYQDLCTDMSVTVPVGPIAPEVRRLLDVTKQALLEGVAAAKVGATIADISAAIQAPADQQGYGIIRSLSGHGVGHAVHEAPAVPNFTDPSQPNIEIKDGMILALEPMFALGDYRVRTGDDGWAVIMADDSLSAHFEVTIACLKNGPEIITPLPV